ncbi:MAG: DUF262 domain-containing protein [Oscillospiraceae bacterium]|jgi:hypothetical protein|nr:DUF262 domain-containing protein [Oscillospiraceae bacterium]
MAIKSNQEKHTVLWLKRQDELGKLNKDISIQRKEVWDAEKKSNLILSVLLDVPIESLLFEEAEGEAHNVLDGKQRTLTLCAYLNDGFALSDKIRISEMPVQQPQQWQRVAVTGQTAVPWVDEDGILRVTLVGRKFSELPEELRQRILDYELSISILRPLTAEERATVFFLRNQAVALSKMDLSLVMLGEAAMNMLNDLLRHPFLAETIKLTAPARRKHDDLQILLQALILQTRPEMGFGGKDIMALCDGIKRGQTPIDADALREALDYLNEALPEKRAYLKKVHIPLLIHLARRAAERLSPQKFGAKLDAFFAKENAQSPIFAEYMAACQSGSAKRPNVQNRLRLLETVLFAD